MANEGIKNIIRWILAIIGLFSFGAIIKDILYAKLYDPFGIPASVLIALLIILFFVGKSYTKNIGVRAPAILGYILIIVVLLFSLFMIYCMWREFFYNLKVLIIWAISIILFLAI